MFDAAGNVLVSSANRRFAVLLLSAMACVSSAALADEIYYVRESGSDGANGRTPETAFATIQKAVGVCDGPDHTIYVGPGAYYEEIMIGTGSGASAGSGQLQQPNRLVGDVTGEATGDPPGPVVIDGEGVRQYGVRIQDRDFWTVQHLTLHNQRSYSVYSYRADNLFLHHCIIEVPGAYALYATICDDIRVEDNTFTRDEDAANCVWIYGGGGEIRVSRNRMSMLGDLYLSSGLGDGYSSWRPGGRQYQYVYGIIVLGAYGQAPARIIIDNNIVSDAYLAIYAAVYNAGDRAYIAHNTVSGALYALYGYNYRGSLTMSDNIVAHSYYAASGYALGTKNTLAGLLTWDIARDAVTPRSQFEISGLVEDEDPLWVAPEMGNFALQGVSPAVDAGTGVVSISTDIRGVVRPYDGDRDDEAICDLGAYEYNPAVDEEASPRIVRWREREPE